MTQRGALVVFLATLLAFAQASREAYRDAYRAWRQADPTLERDAASKGPALGADADRVATEAAKYGAQRGAFLSQAASGKAQELAWLEQAPAGIADVPDGATEVVAAQTPAVRRNIATFSNDPDPGIQQLLGMLQHENAALGALSNSIAARRKAADSVQSTGLAAEQARLAALTAGREALAGLRQVAEESTRETAAWADYYRTLSDGARGAVAIPSAPATTPAASNPIESAPVERRPSVTPVPLARYTGSWTYPSVNGLFHGPEPEAVDLTVHEENGHASGTLVGRFKVAEGDLGVRFDFSGEFKNTRNQTFTLQTSDGAKGTVELIPGPAFNLLEINFHAEATPGKIGQANFLMVKK